MCTLEENGYARIGEKDTGSDSKQQHGGFDYLLRMPVRCPDYCLHCIALQIQCLSDNATAVYLAMPSHVSEAPSHESATTFVVRTAADFQC
jgi:hypothetical protein